MQLVQQPRVQLGLFLGPLDPLVAADARPPILAVVFRYLLVLENGLPADPAAFVVANPVWRVGDTFLSRGGRRFRILGIGPVSDEAAAEDFHAVWTVEELPG